MEILQAQRVLVVKKVDGRRRYQFTEDDKLKLKLKDSGEVIRGSWQYAGEDLIWISGQEVSLDNIRWIDVSGKETGVYLLRKGQDLLILAGLGYFTITQLNSLTETGRFYTGEGVLKVSGGLVAAGLLCTALDRTLLRRKLPVGGEKFSVSLIRNL